MTELAAFIDARLNTSGTAQPTPHMARRTYWENFGRFWDTNLGNYTIGAADQLEMSYRNGLNKSGLGTALRDVHMPRTLRAEDTGGTALPNEVIFSEMNEISGVTTQAQYYQNNPKLYLTAYSGANIYAPPITPGETGPGSPAIYNPVVKRDVNNLSDTGLRDEIEKVLNVGTFTPPASLTIPQYAAQFAAAIKDYYDTDSEMTAVVDTGGGILRYGFEALPIITEVYAQRAYEIQPGPTDNMDGTWAVTWQELGVAGYAIEFRNPFRKPVDLTTVNLWVGGVDWGTVSSLTGQNTLDPDQVVTIHRDSVGGPGNNDVASMIDAGTKVPIGDNWPLIDGPITVGLRATRNISGVSTPMTWPYWTVTTTEGMPETINEAGFPSGSDPAGLQDYKQSVSIGGDETLDMLTVLPTAYNLNGGVLRPANDGQDIIDNLGETPKSIQVTGSLSNPSQEQLVWLDNPDDELTHIGDLALVASIPLDETSKQTVSQAWNGATSADDFRLSFDSAELMDATGDLAVPHAVMLIDRLTTLSPMEDGVDNDGDTAVDDAESPIDEFLLPGTINVNTISRELMLRLLPVPVPTTNPNIRTQLADAIIAYRDADERPNIAGLRTERGIAMLGELMNLDKMPTKSAVMSTDAPDDHRAGGVVVDFVSNPSDTQGDGIVGDREEKTMLARWLAQVASTRSDYFVSFVRVQGVNPFDNAIQTERRAIIIYDRSSVTDGSKDVSVVGMLEY